MKIINKINTAKNSTLIILALVLATWWVLIPWVSFAIGDLSDWLLSTAAYSGPYRLEDKKFFDLLENIFRAWWGIGVLFFCVLTAIQFIALALMSFYLLQVLYRRWKDGTAKLWHFITPVIIIGLAVAFTTAVLCLSYIEVSTWWGESEQVEIYNDIIVPEYTSSA